MCLRPYAHFFFILCLVVVGRLWSVLSRTLPSSISVHGAPDLLVPR